jgi:hypothetical protein
MSKRTIKKYTISPTALGEAIARLKPEAKSARELVLLVRQQIEERLSAGVPLEQIAALMTNTFGVEINVPTLRRYLNGKPTQQDKQIADQTGAGASASVDQALLSRPANSDTAAKKEAS